MKKGRLTPLEQDALAAIVEHSGYKALMLVIEDLVRSQEEAVLRLHISDGVDQLVHAKLRAEGAAKLRSDIANLKAHIKKSDKS